MRFAEQVALVTGGAAGIGWATAARLGGEGARVVLLDRSAEDLTTGAAALEGRSVDCLAVPGDVSRAEDCDRAVGEAIARWGRLDVLVANAGVRASGSILDASEADWDHVLGVNLRGVAYSCRAAARAMTGGGAMVLVSSQMAVVGRASMPIYDAAKAGVLSLTRSLAVEWASRGIRVNAVCPGFTVTDYHTRRTEAAGGSVDGLRATKVGLLGRPADPDEMASAITFLASGDASYITATTLMVDGGAHATAGA